MSRESKDEKRLKYLVPVGGNKPVTRADSGDDTSLRKQIDENFERTRQYKQALDEVRDIAAGGAPAGDASGSAPPAEKPSSDSAEGSVCADDLLDDSIVPTVDEDDFELSDGESVSSVVSGQSSDSKTMPEDAVTKDVLEQVLKDDRKKGSRIEPDKFSGLSKENAETWMRKFKEHAAATGMTEAEKISTFSMLMRGMADIWYSSFLEQTKTEWETKEKNNTLKDGEKWKDISDAFIANFTKSIHCNLHKLHNIKLSDYKDSEAYTNYIQQLGSTLGLRGNALIPYVMRGLSDEMYARVASHQPKTLADHISRISLEDTLMRVQKAKPEVKAVEAAKDKQLSSLAEAVLQMNKTLTELTLAQERSRDDAASRRSDDYRRGDYRRDDYRRNDRRRDDGRHGRDGVRCYNCNRRGHFSRDCHDRRNGGNGNHGGYNGNGRRGNNSRGPRFQNGDGNGRNGRNRRDSDEDRDRDQPKNS